MTRQNKAILASLIYYDLLERPLTALEVFKYLRADTPEVSFFDVWRSLKKSKALKTVVQQKNGLYYLNNGRKPVIEIRRKRTKLAQLKWRKLKKTAKYLTLVPWLRMVTVTGSLTSYNTKKQSDFDLLVVIKRGRIWLGRLLLTGLIGLLGKRRHHSLTQDRICLNCYLTEGKLEITAQAKPRDFHSAQEYARLTPVLETKTGIHANFICANYWLTDFLKNYPWPNSRNAKRTRAPMIFTYLRQITEWLLSRQTGDILEKIAAIWQNRRINKKRKNEQTGEAGQIFISNYCLMFHPQSKSCELMKSFDLKMEQLGRNKRCSQSL